MLKSKIKICGIKDISTLDCCIQNKVDFFGLIFYEKSPRNITFNEAKNLTDLSRNLNIKPVGVFVNHEINDLKKISDDKLVFLKAISNVIKSGMDIVGVDAPSKM